MSRSHRGLVKNSLDRPVRLQVRPSFCPLPLFVLSLWPCKTLFIFFLGEVEGRKEAEKGGNEKRERDKGKMTCNRGKVKRGDETEMGGERRARVLGGREGGGSRSGGGCETQSCHFPTGEMNDFLPLDTGP